MNETEPKNQENLETEIVEPPQSGAATFQKALAVFFSIVAVLYTVSPIDISPDAIPVVGWLDDVGVLLTAGVNAVQQFSRDQNSFFVKLLKYVKWFMVLAIVAVALLFGGLIAAIIALVTK